MKNIVLVGFMGTGKTVVSKILASRLKMQRLCVDDMIEWKVGKPVSRIFAEDGEPFFRKIESDMVGAVSKDRDSVIDAGGGIVIDEHNVKHLKEHGILFCLTAREDVILKRTSKYNNRPLLDAQDPLARIKNLLSERKEYYTRADHIVDTSDITPDEAADKIVEIMKDEESEKKRHLIFTPTPTLVLTTAAKLVWG
ncbi:MAG: shikimate kinase [Candidatus Omnitrophota bacterium]